MNKVLFCGGYTEFIGTMGGIDFTAPIASIDIFNINNGQWFTGTMQVNKGGFAAISIDEKVYLAGGEVNHTATFHVEELNVNTMTSTYTCLHQPMRWSNPVIKNDKIIFLTNSFISGIELNKFDIYNTRTGIWSVGVLPPGLIKTGTPIYVESANNEIYTVIGTKLYKMNL